jgi:hypothetical protein
VIYDLWSASKHTTESESESESESEEVIYDLF